MRILAIETATDRCGVALVEDGQLVSELLLTRPRSHAEFLVPMTEQALALGRVEARDLQAVAVSMGPGSYTGLRIGVSTAKGLAFGAGAALIGVPSLLALARSVAAHARVGDIVLCAFSARRQEVYAALYQVMVPLEGSGPSQVVSILDAAAVPVAELPGWLPRIEAPLWIAGDGADSIVSALKEDDRQDLSVRRSELLPSAAAVAMVGQELMETQGPADLAAFEPFYLKEFVARKPKRTIFDRLPF